MELLVGSRCENKHILSREGFNDDKIRIFHFQTKAAFEAIVELQECFTVFIALV